MVHVFKNHILIILKMGLRTIEGIQRPILDE